MSGSGVAGERGGDRGGEKAGGARPSPYALVFEAEGFDASRFAVLREQAAAHGAVTAGEVLGLPTGGELLRELAPEGSSELHRELVAQVGALLFHGFRHWLHGRIVYRVTQLALNALLDAPAVTWTFRAPAPAGYVQLPYQVFWARPAENAAAEPVDGFFWSAPDETEGARGRRLDLLLALGVRAGRPGFTVVPVSLEPEPDPAGWADTAARPDGRDFENVLPGGELQGYRALTTHAEAVKLAVRVFRHIDTHPDSIAVQGGVCIVGDG